MKQKGILLPIFSLPSNYGIGDFGYEAYKFVDILSENKIEYWEILPITATKYSPYSPQSYYALNTDYISLDKLKDMKLLDKVENFENISFDNYKKVKEKFYKIAYAIFKETDEYHKFKENEKILEYAKYMQKNFNLEVEYSIFLQYILDKQWNELKKYANSKNVKIIGDMPIYPDFYSVEVENNSLCFQLKNGTMEYVSGVPSDKYNKDGQIWGTPVYNYNYMKENNYLYLIERYKEFLKRFDIVRIDHFIGYDSYYKIPINKNANTGIYEEGPGNSFFNELLKISEAERFIVEDLGNIKESTIKLKNTYNFIGSAIIQHVLDLNENDYYNTENVVLYSSTHDCNTIVGWYKTLSVEDRKKLRFLLKSKNCNSIKIHKAIIKYCMKSKARIVILPFQDILGLGSNARINVPGKDLKENWNWRINNFNEFKRKIKYFAKL